METIVVNEHLSDNKEIELMTIKRILGGRPRISVDFAIVLRLRDADNLGWSRMAENYRELTGKYVSRDTIKRRYLEAKALSPDNNAIGKVSGE